jgi:hypothetical protein
MALSGCNLPQPSVSIPPTPPNEVIQEAPSPTTDPQSPTPSLIPANPEFTGEGMGTFRVAILIDLGSERVPHEAARVVVQQASSLLQYQTGFTIEVTDIQEVYLESTITEMAAGYVESLDGEIPNGLVILSYGDDDRAKLYGGYVSWVAGFEGFRNEFISPIVGDQHVYLAVMHWSHRYGACGYDGTDEVVSLTSIGGECRNQPGTACVQQWGYSICANVLDNLYASTPTYFLAANIVHEFLHPFGTGTGDDHYGSPHCQEIMGWTEENWTFSVEEAERYNGVCPNLYAAFDRGYRP